MGKLFFTIGTLAIWGLLIWGNTALISWINTSYHERMASNYLVNTYEGRLLLNQTEYTEFKKSLLSKEVIINGLDVYSSDEVLVIYNLKSPESHTIPFIDNPQSQEWHYERGRGGDYGATVIVILFSIVVGTSVTMAIYQTINEVE